MILQELPRNLKSSIKGVKDLIFNIMDVDLNTHLKPHIEVIFGHRQKCFKWLGMLKKVAPGAGTLGGQVTKGKAQSYNKILLSLVQFQ